MWPDQFVELAPSLFPGSLRGAFLCFMRYNIIIIVIYNGNTIHIGDASKTNRWNRTRTEGEFLISCMFDASPAAHHPTEDWTLYSHVVVASGRSSSNLDSGREFPRQPAEIQSKGQNTIPCCTLWTHYGVFEMHCRLNGSHKWCITTYKIMNGPKMLQKKITA
jgi:hypothetical protein